MNKKKYVKPCIEVISMQSEESVMIPVSGTTTPEESQAKQFDMWTDNDDESLVIGSHGLWDDEEDN